jgi:uncharacterized protein (TIGR02246 family)
MSFVTDVIDRQVEAYLSRDLEGFLAHYTPDSKITDLDGNVLMDWEAMREQYGVLFRDSPDLTARIANRIVVGDMVIDEEEIHAAHHPDYPSDVHAAVAYHVSGDKIDRVVFLKIE